MVRARFTLIIAIAGAAATACSASNHRKPAVTESSSQQQRRADLTQSLNLGNRDQPPLSLAEMEAALAKNPGPTYGIGGHVLRLAQPEQGVPLLRRLLQHNNELMAIEAAAALAVLGQRDGVERLRNVKTATSSHIEFWYASEALTLLGEPVPEAIRSKLPMHMQAQTDQPVLQ
ncbi:MAG TPA: hypothetical protein PLF40_05245 [Kofleriaceae bacterium]|nr:hypothetical protein [Kofleriaceae bacterium]